MRVFATQTCNAHFCHCDQISNCAGRNWALHGNVPSKMGKTKGFWIIKNPHSFAARNEKKKPSKSFGKPSEFRGFFFFAARFGPCKSRTARITHDWSTKDPEKNFRRAESLPSTWRLKKPPSVNSLQAGRLSHSGGFNLGVVPDDSLWVTFEFSKRMRVFATRTCNAQFLPAQLLIWSQRSVLS